MVVMGSSCSTGVVFVVGIVKLSAVAVIKIVIKTKAKAKTPFH